ncbi:hypothetical protein H8356DRAFT_1091312 [Neocallimastix lanati (nom. inval.)]|nr:hypothetical protein H8356DRAFT_1091312 [Neocallimastix sp. JGI-2020a]
MNGFHYVNQIQKLTIRPAVHDVGVHVSHGVNHQIVSLLKTKEVTDGVMIVVTDSGCEIPEYECYDLMNKTWGPQEYPVGTEKGVQLVTTIVVNHLGTWPGNG